MIARPPLAVPLLGLGGFLALLALVIAGWAPLGDADAAVSGDFRAYGDRHAGVVALFRVATDVAATVPFVLFGIVVTAALLTLGERRAGAFTGLVTATVPASWSLLHWLVHHPRPRNGFVLVQSNGFPSGHATDAGAMALVAVLLLWPRGARAARVVAVALAAGFAIFIGLTRVALLAHWPGDVLGGWLLALAVVPLAARAAQRLAPPGPLS
jgi:membrane-associated phospholipid phosphatase